MYYDTTLAMTYLNPTVDTRWNFGTVPNEKTIQKFVHVFLELIEEPLLQMKRHYFIDYWDLIESRKDSLNIKWNEICHQQIERLEKNYH